MKNNILSFKKAAALNIALISAIGALSIPVTNGLLKEHAKEELSNSKFTDVKITGEATEKCNHADSSFGYAFTAKFDGNDVNGEVCKPSIGSKTAIHLDTKKL